MKYFEKFSNYGRLPSEVEKGVKETIITQLGVNKNMVIPKASLVKDLGADDLDLTELTMALEKNFNISIPDKASYKIKTVGDYIKYIGKN
jgi:acyl carrier protein